MINSNQDKFAFIDLLLGMCSIEGAEEATGTIAAETRELEAIEAVINGGHGTSMRPLLRPFVNWGWCSLGKSWGCWPLVLLMLVWEPVEAMEAMDAMLWLLVEAVEAVRVHKEEVEAKGFWQQNY